MRGTKPVLKTDDAAIQELLPAPAWLNEDARAEWERVFPSLAARRILTEGDLGSLESYCVAMGRIRQAERVIAAKGMTVSLRNGPRKRPEVQIQAEAQTIARQLAAELGLTPVSRSRPSIRDDGDDDSILDL